MDYTEDTLVQQTTSDYLVDELGWRSIFAYNQEVFGEDGTLGRLSDREVILKVILRRKLRELNSGLPDDVYDQAVQKLCDFPLSGSLITINREKYELIRDGIKVTYRTPRNKQKRTTLRVIDFSNPDANDFLCVRELWVKGDLYRRRTDIVGFVNGIPLLFMELKNLNRSVEVAFSDNFSDYKTTIPHLFYYNAFVVLANGADARIGSVTSPFRFFNEWKRLKEDEPGQVDHETLLKGVCKKENFLDLFENFILFDDSMGKTIKILARNHQFLGVNRAMKSVRERKESQGRLGVFWHTQGAGKSYSMVFFTRKVLRRLGGNFTFLILTDREDLDTQIYKTFAGCGIVNQDRESCRAVSGEHLKLMLSQHKSFIFTLIQKFNQDVTKDDPYSDREDIIVISDEAHRTQYGMLALNMRNAIPNASYIGFTGTPLFKDDEITRKVFGEYVSTYDFLRAVEDEATVPLFYDARGEKLQLSIEDLNERIAEKLEEFEAESIDVEQRLENELKREYHVITASKRLERIAKDFVAHYSRAWETGKVMFVCIDKLTCVRMYNLIEKHWKKQIERLVKQVPKTKDEQEELDLKRRIDWMRQTRMAVVISEEQGEVEKFQKWDLDILPHRRLLKEGIDLPDDLKEENQFRNLLRLPLDQAFKEEKHPFRIAIVCAMWLTGFDVPCLSTLCLDKPLKAHTLMQAIARANRVHEGKNNGLIVDYCGILKNLRKALATYVTTGDSARNGQPVCELPVKPEDELIAELEESIGFVDKFLQKEGVSLSEIIISKGFTRNAAIQRAKEVANQNDESRKRFEVLCRAVFSKFKACINIESIDEFRNSYGAVNIVYKSLQQDREKADISDILKKLHMVVDDAIDTQPMIEADKSSRIYDISKIDFERLSQEFARSKTKNTDVQNLKNAIEKRIQSLLDRNPLRTDFQKRYDEIIANYNREKERATIEKTFEELLKFVQELNEEENRAAREGLDEESLAIFDLIRKPHLSPTDIRKVKKVTVGLLESLKEQLQSISQWREKESTRDSVRNSIYNYLFSDETGLPIESFTEEDIGEYSDRVFQHVFRVYPEVPSPVYAS